MAIFAHSNFAVSTLQGDISAAQTTLQLNVDDIARFPVLTGGAVFPLVIADDEDQEIVYVSALSGAGVATIQRGREGTLAQSWLAGTLLRHTFTAASVIGASTLRPRGEWNSGTAYSIGDIATRLGISYIAVNANTNSTPASDGTNANWQVFYNPGGGTGKTMNWQSRYSASTTYTAGMVAEFQGRTWVALQTTTGNAPAVGSAFWEVVGDSGRIIDNQAPVALTGLNNYVATVTSAQAPSALYDGLSILLRPGATNTGAATLQINAFAAVPWRPASGVNFAAGDIIAGEIYEATYIAAAGEFIGHSSAGIAGKIATASGTAAGAQATADAVTTALATLRSALCGTVLPYAGASVDPNYGLMCYGQAVSRTTYSALFARIGTTYGTGNGSTTFNVPDMRGLVPAGMDNMGGTAASRLPSLGSVAITLGAMGGESNHTITIAEMPAHNHTGVTGNESADHTHNYTQASGTFGVASGAAAQCLTTTQSANTGTDSVTHNHSIQSQGGGTAMNNVQPVRMLNYIILV